MKTRIKICGITNQGDAAAALESGADYIGLVFAKSPRQITLDRAREIRAALPDAPLVGVFVDEGPDVVAPIVEALRLRAVQVEGWLDRVPWEPCDVWHVVRGQALPDVATLPMIPLRTYLLDAYDCEKGGGTGKRADWEWAKVAVRDGLRLFVAGGLTPSNVGSLVLGVRPYGVDVSSGLESAPGRKDHAKVRDFIESVRRADRDRPKSS